MKRVLIIGVTSAIAEGAARIFAERGDAIFPVARDAGRLSIIADDLKARGGSVPGQFVMDANDLDAHGSMLQKADATLGGIDIVLMAHGTLPDQKACEKSVAATLAEIQTNALSAVALLTLLANYFEERKKGAIAVISSVAGDRGRRSNYVYGSAKAMVTTFLSGLRHRLARSSVTVTTIKPGFVDTPMTAGFKKGLLWAKPEAVAKGIVSAIERKKPTAYLPAFWYPVMLVIRCLPEKVFVRLPL